MSSFAAREAARLAALEAYRPILGSPPEPAFDRITRLAAEYFRAPVAAITLVDRNFSYFKSCHGLEVRRIRRKGSFCGHTIRCTAALIIPDVSADERFASGSHPPGIRFYAGVPLTVGAGEAVGTLSIMDRMPRSILTAPEEGALRDFAALVMETADQRLPSSASPSRRELLEAVLDHVPAMLHVVDRHGGLRYMNRESQRVLGWSFEEAGSRDLLAECFPDPADFESARAFIAECSEQWREFTLRVRDGSTRRIAWSNVRLSDGNVLGIGHDVTEEHRTGKLLRNRDRVFRLLIEHAAELTSVIDADGKWKMHSPSLESTLGWSPESQVGKDAQAIVHAGDRPAIEDALKKISSVPGGSTAFEGRFKHRRGGWRDMEGVATNLLHVEGLEGIVLNAHDVTDRKRVQEQLQSSYDQLRKLAAHLESVRERERIRISREIHDELGQMLSALKMEVENLAAQCRKAGAPRVQRELGAIAGKINLVIQTVRRISAELRPSVLDHLGLAAAIEWHAKEFQASAGIPCRIRTSMPKRAIPSEHATAAFRIFQEILTNVARHAHASLVQVELIWEGEQMLLRVSDDGKGLDERHLAGAGGLGLTGMRERAALLGGRVDFARGPRKGTIVTVRIPLPKICNKFQKKTL